MLQNQDEFCIYHNANIITQDPHHPRALAMRVEQKTGIIVELYAESPAQTIAGTRVDLEGAIVMPGFIDAHFHLRLLGERAVRIDLMGCRSGLQALKMVGEQAQTQAPGSWILGAGWNQERWFPQALPTLNEVDAILPDQPMALWRADLHALWVNSMALHLAGITQDSGCPEGGEIVRDGAGRPSGLLLDNAIALLNRVIPHTTPSAMREQYMAGAERCAELGITTVHEMGVSPSELEVLIQLDHRYELQVRVVAYVCGTREVIQGFLKEKPYIGNMLEVVGVKLFIDGALGSRGAAMLEPYSDHDETHDCPGSSTGLLIMEPDELMATTRAVHGAGWQLAIHAIGDRGNRLALDAIEHAQMEYGPGVLPHRIEHAQIVHAADLPRFKQLGVVASMQPVHATADMDWVENRIGRSRLPGAYAWRALKRSGVSLVFGSDAPVEHADPWRGVAAGVGAYRADGAQGNAWLQAHCLDLRSALVAFNTAAACAVGRSSHGRLAPGCVADFIIVGRDPWRTPAGKLSGIGVRRRVLAGRF